MSVADCCGLQSPDGAVMVAAKTAWVRWSAEFPVLRAMEGLTDIHRWARSVPSRQANEVLSVLAAMTDREPEATTALAWALLPGAEAVAHRLADLAGNIDGLVAGQLWIEAGASHRLTTPHIAGTILAQTRREVCAELGIGALAKRRDQVWAESVHLDPAFDVPDPRDPWEPEVDPFWEVTELMIEAIDANAIHVFDAWLIGELARRAAALETAGHRGRMGLTAPAVIGQLADVVHLSARALRRRASTALDRMAEFVRVREDPKAYAVWRAQHASCPVTAAEEMQLVITEDCDAHFFRTRDLPADAWAPDVDPARRRPSTG